MAEDPNTETNEELRMRLRLMDLVKSERDISDERYSRKLVEKIVFGTIILFALAALFFIFTKVGLPQPSL